MNSSIFAFDSEPVPRRVALCGKLPRIDLLRTSCGTMGCSQLGMWTSSLWLRDACWGPSWSRPTVISAVRTNTDLRRAGVFCCFLSAAYSLMILSKTSGVRSVNRQSRGVALSSKLALTPDGLGGRKRNDWPGVSVTLVDTSTHGLGSTTFSICPRFAFFAFGFAVERVDDDVEAVAVGECSWTRWRRVPTATGTATASPSLSLLSLSPAEELLVLMSPSWSSFHLSSNNNACCAEKRFRETCLLGAAILTALCFDRRSRLAQYTINVCVINWPIRKWVTETFREILCRIIWLVKSNWCWSLATIIKPFSQAAVSGSPYARVEKPSRCQRLAVAKELTWNVILVIMQLNVPKVVEFLDSWQWLEVRAEMSLPVCHWDERWPICCADQLGGIQAGAPIHHRLELR